MIRVLVVNSKSSFLSKVHQISHHPKYEFIVVDNGNAGIDFFRKKPIDAVISHLGINNNFDDLELMLTLKEIRPHVPIIVVLGDNSLAKPDNVLKAGAFACLGEETTPSELMRYVEMAVN
jgi:DNA-binding NtrC family response regulator